MRALRCLLGTKVVEVKGRLVTGLVRWPLPNHDIMAERS